MDIEYVMAQAERKGLRGEYLGVLQGYWDVWEGHHEQCQINCSLRGLGPGGKRNGAGGTISFSGYKGDGWITRTYYIGRRNGKFDIQRVLGAGLKR